MTSLEKLFQNYLDKKEEYNKVVEPESNGIKISGDLTRGPKVSMTKAHKKFMKEFKKIHGDDLQSLINWQNERI